MRAYIAMLLCSLLISAGCAEMRPNCRREERGFDEKVSFLRLLAQPALYHGKRIVLNGYLVLDYEDTSIYPLKEFYEADMTEEKIAVRFSDAVQASLPSDWRERFNKRYVGLRGVFDKDETGRWGMSSFVQVDFILLHNTGSDGKAGGDREEGPGQAVKHE